ncbi:hypothetical protein PIB30_022253 [Stylosanthes scabra]|uniref:Retrotransposon gag domain-containing protein n=1 Tax=Stylosanthes scabra TaxID=79078 RepID=A0ABU6R9E6_9FABA|nr:hypothetical protein [Stylosanthes scabra]
MTIVEYTRKFEDLCHFSRIGQGNQAEFEEWKCIKYEGGLREELLTFVGPMEIRNFAELVNKGQLAEDCTKKLTATRTGRREQPSRNFKRTLALPGRNFKNNGQIQCHFPSARNNFPWNVTISNPQQNSSKGLQQSNPEGRDQSHLLPTSLDKITITMRTMHDEKIIDSVYQTRDLLGEIFEH